MNAFVEWLTKPRMSRSELLDFYEMCEMASKLGKDASFVMSALLDKATRKSEKDLWTSMLARYETGAKLSSILKEYVTPDEYLLFKAADESNNYTLAFNSAIRMANIKSKILKIKVSALTYPLLMIVLVHVMAYSIHKQTGNVFTKILPADRYPVIASSFETYINTVFSVWGVLILLGVGLIYAAIRYSYSHWQPLVPGKPASRQSLTRRLRSFCDNWIPGYRGYKELTAFSFLLAFGNFLRVCEPDLALEIISRNSKPWLRTITHAVYQRMKAGLKPADALDIGFIPKSTAKQYYVYEKADAFERALAEPPRAIIDRMYARVTFITSLTAALLFAYVGLMVLWTMASLMTPALALQQYIKSVTRGF